MAVTGHHWDHALFLLYFYCVCMIYGFGTLVVAINTSRELQMHGHALEALRVDYLSGAYLGWGPEHGCRQDRQLARDVSLSVREVRDDARAGPGLFDIASGRCQLCGSCMQRDIVNAVLCGPGARHALFICSWFTVKPT
jgi:hypothetical protein